MAAWEKVTKGQRSRYQKSRSRLKVTPKYRSRSRKVGQCQGSSGVNIAPFSIFFKSFLYYYFIFLTKIDCVHLFIHVQCCNNTYMYTICHFTISCFKKITSGQNGDLAVIWIFKVHTLITFLRLPIMNICVLVGKPPMHTNILISLDWTSCKNKARYSTFCKKSTLFTSFQRTLTSSFRPLKSFFWDRLLRYVISGPWRFFSNWSDQNRSQSFFGAKNTFQLILLLANKIKRHRQFLVLEAREN